MKFRDFQHFGKKLHIFNLNGIRKIDPNFHRQQLGYWLKSGYVKSFANGYYLLSDAELNENSLFMLANRIYEPSYISLESALAYYSIIPEYRYWVCSALALEKHSNSRVIGAG